MAAGKQQNEGGSQIEMVWLIVAVLAILLGWLVWTHFKAAIVMPAFAVDYAFIWIVEHVKGLGERGQETKAFVESFFDGTRNASNPNDISWQNFSTVRTVVGSQVNWVIAGLIALLAIHVRMNMKGTGYQRVYSLAGGKGKKMSFAKFQAETWRVASYSANFDPDGRDADILPPLTPPEWLKKNGIRFEENELDHDATRAAFTEQLGKQWHGFDRATIYCKLVLIICALHWMKREDVFPGFGKKNTSLHEREVLSIAWSGGKNGDAAVKALVDKYSKDAKVRKIIDTVGSKHAYENTVVYAMLDRARAKGGVLKEHDMLYIKRLDRHMWYGLNNCGRKRFLIEGAGILSHFFAERIANRALIEPYLDPACEGVEHYLYEEGIESLAAFYQVRDEDAY
jgi:intracellular multiplication protein IcmP